jgi:hypothetical protein
MIASVNFGHRTGSLAIDYRSYQMSHCVSIPMIFVSAIFARATLKGPYRPDAIWQRDANFQFSMTFNFNIFQCFSNISNNLSNFSYLVCISCKIFIR